MNGWRVFGHHISMRGSRLTNMAGVLGGLLWKVWPMLCLGRGFHYANNTTISVFTPAPSVGQGPLSGHL